MHLSKFGCLSYCCSAKQCCGSDNTVFFPVPVLFCFSSGSGLAVFKLLYNILLFMLEVGVVMCLWDLLSFHFIRRKVLDPTCSGSGSGSTTMVLSSLSADFAVKLFTETLIFLI